MEQVLLLAVPLVAIVTGIVQGVKQMDVIDSRYLPVVAIVLGAILGGLASTVITAPLAHLVWAGALSGLASCGLYDGISGITNKE